MKNFDNKSVKHGKKKVKIFKKRKRENIDDVIKRLLSSYDKIVPESINNFTDFPLSFNTLKGLRENDFTVPTEIQKQSIGYALQGNDILGAAKTGSGKTLAFLIPVLEVLFCKKWTTLDGVGALIITPTRELAYQIFETLRKVGRYHDFSAGLIIGGKDLHFEKKRMDQCNIIICTPGRLLHHMDENPLFDCVNLQILVLDEADNCLNLGFEETMNSIIANLPSQRQTLLFSATQTKSIRDLARLSLTNPKYLSVHENATHSTPEELTQSYVVCELEDKISNLWSFIKSHVKHKILVFFATCKQVKYTFEMFCQLRPGIALLQLHGGMHQEKRMAMYRSFCSKKYAVLFATDIAARGLDFPEVNWVIQVDCPEDATTYIHRVGRTARYYKGGEAVMLLLPSEKDTMLQHLTEKKVPLQEIKVNPLKLQNPRIKFEAILAKKPDLKASAQRAFVTYLKSVFLMKDKKVFDIHKLNTDLYARSLGLVVSPRIRFLTKQENAKKAKKGNVSSLDNDGSDINSRSLVDKLKNGGDENSSDETVEPDEELGKEKSNEKLQDKKKKRPNSFQTFDFEGGGLDSDEDDDDILKIKREDHDLEGSDDGEPLDIGPGRRQKKPVTKAALAKKALRKNIIPNKKTVFTEEGEAVENKFKQRISEAGKKYEADSDLGGINIEEAKKILKEEDKIDKQLFREKVKAKHREERLKMRNAKKKKGSDEESDVESMGEGDEFSGSDGDDSASGERYRSSDRSEENPSDYSDNSSQEDIDNNDDNDSDDDEEDSHTQKSSLRDAKPRKGVKRKRQSDGDLSEFAGSSLIADEELALQLLKRKR